MLLFKKKKCLQCISHPFLVLSMIYVRKWFFLKIKLEIYPCTMLL